MTRARSAGAGRANPRVRREALPAGWRSGGARAAKRDAGLGEGPASGEVLVAENTEIADVDGGGRQPAMIAQPRGGAGVPAARSAGAAMTSSGSSGQPAGQYSAGRLKITARLTILPSRTLK